MYHASANHSINTFSHLHTNFNNLRMDKKIYNISSIDLLLSKQHYYNVQ